MTDPAAVPISLDWLTTIITWCAKMAAVRTDCLELKALFAETFEEERAKVRLAEAIKVARRIE